MNFDTWLGWPRRLMARHRKGLVIAGAVALFALGVASHWIFSDGSQESVASRGDSAAGAPRQATMWTCSMHPHIRQPEPGQCPICGVDRCPDAAG